MMHHCIIPFLLYLSNGMCHHIGQFVDILTECSVAGYVRLLCVGGIMIEGIFSPTFLCRVVLSFVVQSGVEIDVDMSAVVDVAFLPAVVPGGCRRAGRGLPDAACCRWTAVSGRNVV